MVIDGDFDDWDVIRGDGDNVACDGGQPAIEPQPDRDAPVQSTGRDLIEFAQTWDNTYIYLYTRRTGQSQNTERFVYWADLDADGLLETGDPLFVSEWQGNTRELDILIGSYVEATPGGDPMVDGNGFADGYTILGTSVGFPPPGSPNYTFAPGGGADGLEQEFRVPWADLGIVPNPYITFHVGSTNSQPGAASFPDQIDDNMGGCGGGGGILGNIAVTFTPDRSISYTAGTIEYAAHAITNDGDGTDTFDLTSGVSGAFSPTVSYYKDADASGTFSVGDTLLTDTDGDSVPDTGSLAPGATLNILIAYAIPAGAGGTVSVISTATSSNLVLVSDSVTDLLGGPPFVTFQASSSSTAESGTHQVILELVIPDGGTADNDVVVEVTDLLTGTARSTDYSNIGTTTLTFPAGSGDGATQVLSIPILADTLTEGDETIDLRITNITNGSEGNITNHEVTIVDDETATVSFQSSSSATPDESAQTHNVVLVLSTSGSSIANDVVVDVTDLLTGSATSTGDYNALATPVQLTFPAGSVNGATVVVPITIIPDAVTEGNETIGLQILNVSGPASTGSIPDHEVTITDDDGAFIHFLETSSSLGEATTGHPVIVELVIPGGGSLTSDATVDVTDAFSGTAASASDYTAIGTATITFSAGSVSGATQVFTLNVLDDALLESAETVDLQLSNAVSPDGVVVGAATQHEVTITDDETGSVTFALDSSSVAESATTHNVIVTLSSSGTLQDAETVDVTDLLTGTATSGSDYTALAIPVTVTFPAGAGNGATQVVAIPILDDSLVENDETINLRLSNPSSPLTLGGTTNHVVTITDDEAPATVSFDQASSASTDEATNTNPVIVRLSVPGGGTPGSAVSVEVDDLLTGTASTGTDYGTLSSPVSINFPAGSADGATAVVNIGVIQDNLVEGDETVNLQMSNPTGPLGLGAITNHVFTISDDEQAATVAFQTAFSTAAENGGTHQVAVRLSISSGSRYHRPRHRICDFRNRLHGPCQPGHCYLCSWLAGWHHPSCCHPHPR